MAIHAGNFFVFPEEWEFGFCMVEWSNDGPLAEFVTGVAFLAQISLVRLIFLVATETRCWSLGIFLALDVTAYALNLLVCAGDRIIGKVMIECVGIQSHDGNIPAYMLGVATAAGHANHQLASTVKPGRGLAIFADGFVAIQAQGVLRLAG